MTLNYMSTIYNISLFVLIFLMCICVILFLKKKSLTAKLQVTLPFNTLAIMTMSLYFYYTDQPGFLDITILYALLSYVSILSFCKYYKMHIFKARKKDDTTVINSKNKIKTK